jgi:hypothetical protein
MIGPLATMDAFFSVLFMPWNATGMQKYSTIAFGIKSGFIPDTGMSLLPVREFPDRVERNLLLQWGRLKPENEFLEPFKNECKLVFILDHYNSEEFQDVTVNGFSYTGLRKGDRVIYFAIGW